MMKGFYISSLSAQRNGSRVTVGRRYPWPVHTQFCYSVTFKVSLLVGFSSFLFAVCHLIHLIRL